MKDPNQPKSLMEAIQYFANDAVCVEYMCKLRYDEGKPVCPYCGSLNTMGVKNRPKFRCRERECGKQFSMKKGTLMEDSPLPLTKWLPALWLVANDKNGISSCEVARALNITQKSAWFLLMRCRVAMKNGSILKLSGEVEIDETYVGGRTTNMHAAQREVYVKNRRANSNKTVVMGMVQRGGKVVAKVVDSARRKALIPEIVKHVEEGATVYTDALHSYDVLGAHYNHSTVDHSQVFVNGAAHTNTMENFWCLFKRSLKGTYTQCAPFHVDKYVTEQAFRYNERFGNDAQRFNTILSQVFDRRLTWKELTGKVVVVK
jgi:transposase-like protein